MIGAAVCEILDQNRERVDTLDKRIQELFDRVNSVLEWVPSGLGHLVDGIVEGMKWLAQATSGRRRRRSRRRRSTTRRSGIR
ncbi:MAG: hypothetical protein GEU86_06970 [Actinophytocola sp.]|nr:hypothetical protein [Actinophytocola sp.]